MENTRHTKACTRVHVQTQTSKTEAEKRNATQAHTYRQIPVSKNIGHNYIGHNYICRNYIGHNYIGHAYIYRQISVSKNNGA